MKCHYEVLGITRDANDSEIKTAYRKLALRWHPDKNPDQMDEAKEQFQLLQQAYEVLSDLNERTWYDNHREQILRGKNSDYEENCLDLFQYFTASCFRGYYDDPGGFYSVYAEVFEKIAAEDIEFMDDEEEIEAIPQFGKSESSYENVVGPFYAYWQSYCTKKSYAWLCPYNISEIKDRRILREIDKDMKKVVQKAKRERNEEVRNLVSFVRKRDKRVQKNKKLLEEKAARNRLKQEQNRLEQIRKRNLEMEEHRKTQSHSRNEEYEEQLRQLAQEYGDSDADKSAECCSTDTDDLADGAAELDLNDGSYMDDLYCVACNKSFKNDNAFLNHETSKKHRENVERLKSEMHTEERTLVNAEGEPELNGCDRESSGDISENELIPETKPKEKKNKKNKRNNPERKHDVEEENILDILGDLENESKDWTDGKKGKKTKSRKQNAKIVPSQSQQPAEPVASVKETVSDVHILDLNHTCVTCNSAFDSKNKLFNHLKKVGHGVYIPKAELSAKEVVSNKKKGKRNK